MCKKFVAKILIFAFLSVSIVLAQESIMLVVAKTEDEIRISGLVERPLTLTPAELLSFPMISEVATLYCPFDDWEVTFNWTGVPIFHLLTLAEVKPEGRSVNIVARDGYFLNIRIEEVLKPTTILALKGNGTVLSEMKGREGGFRIVFPCKYGYNWVTDVREIAVTDRVPANEPDMRNCVMPSVTPPLQLFNLAFGKKEFQVEVFTNVSIMGFRSNQEQRQLSFDMTVPAEKTGFANFILPQDLLKGPYSVFIDEESIEFTGVNVTSLAFIYVIIPEGSHVVRIVCAGFLGGVPEILVEFKETIRVDRNVVFDASKSVDDGIIVSFEWDFGDDMIKNGAVVSHSFSAEGVYQVVLNVTDDEGIGNFKVFTVVVGKQQYADILLLIAALIVSALVSILMTVLLRGHKPEELKGILKRIRMIARTERIVRQCQTHTNQLVSNSSRE